MDSDASIRETMTLLRAGRAWQLSAQDMVALTRAVLDRFEELHNAEYHGADEAGLVSATVSGRGELTQVSITPKAIRETPEHDLGPACAAAIRTAYARADAATSALMTTLGMTDPDGGGRTPPDPTRLLATVRDAARKLR